VKLSLAKPSNIDNSRPQPAAAPTALTATATPLGNVSEDLAAARSRRSFLLACSLIRSLHTQLDILAPRRSPTWPARKRHYLQVVACGTTARGRGAQDISLSTPLGLSSPTSSLHLAPQPPATLDLDPKISTPGTQRLWLPLVFPAARRPRCCLSSASDCSAKSKS
jgi:hypothetical protein